MSSDDDPRVPGESAEGGGSFSEPITPSGELVKRLTAHAPRETRYSIQGELARGGMGAILRVWDEDLRRTLAMKVILGKEDPASATGTPPVDERSLGRFLEEAQVTGQLDHPGIVPVHELGLDASGRVYFTMRLVKGRDLKQIIDLVRENQEGWTRTRALSVIVKVCEAMAYAHAKGVIHRDLKPSNIMVGRFGETYVMDWGLAKVIGREDRHDIRLQEPIPTSTVKTEQSPGGDDPGSPLLTMDGTVVGTPAYMSPEQARGEVEQVGVRSDVYSVGAMLYHLLAGHMPYVPPGIRASAHAVWRWVIEGPPRAVHAIRPDVPAELVAICEKAMARDAERRYSDTMRMAEDILAYLEGRVVRAYETGAVAEFRKWVARNRGLAAASAAAILVAIVGLAAIGFVQARGKKDARAGWAMAEARAAEATESARNAKYQSYVANIAAADLSLRDHKVAEAKRRLDACDESLRGWEWRHLRLRADTSLAVLSGHEGPVDLVVVSPDGARFASAGRDGTVRVWDAVTGEPKTVLRGHRDWITGIGFSSDGKGLASISRDGEVREWDIATGNALHVLPADPARAHVEAAVSSDGTRVALSFESSPIQVCDTRTGESLRTFPVRSEDLVRRLAFSPDGSTLAATFLQSDLRAWDTKTGEIVLNLTGQEGGVTAMRFGADGSRLATASGNRTIRIWDVRSGTVSKQFKGHEGSIESLCFSPNGEWLASGSADGTVRVWDLGGGGDPEVFEGHERGVRSVAFTADGGRVVSASLDGTCRVWGVHRGGAVQVLRNVAVGFSAIAFSPDGSRVLSGLPGKRGWIWDTWRGAPLLVLKGIDVGMSPIAMTDGASRIAVATFNEDHSVGLWDRESGQSLGSLRGHEKDLGGMAFSPDGTRIVTGGWDRTVRIWDAGTRETLRILKGHEGEVRSIAYSHDGRRIASGSDDHTIRIWDAQSGEPQLVLRGHAGSVEALAFSPDDSLLLSGSEDRTVRLWSASDGKSLKVLSGHDGIVQSLAFGPDPSRFLSGSIDETIRVWDAGSGECLLVLRNLEGLSVTGLAVSPDGSRIAAACFDGNVRIWETSASLVHDPMRAVEPILDSLFANLGIAEEVVDRLQKDASLAEDVRTEALRVARLRPEDPETLNTLGWNLAHQPGASPESYAKAVRCAERACALRPKSGLMLNTLGVAQFRAGRYEDSLNTLTRSDRINQGNPADVAFLAMALKRLGKDEEAQAALARLRDLMKGAKWSGDTDLVGFTKEAERVVAGDDPDARGK